MLKTAAERIAVIQIFCVAFHTVKYGFELSVAAAPQMLQMAGGEDFLSISCSVRHFNVPPKQNVIYHLDCRESSRGRDRVPGGGGIVAMVTRKEVRIYVSARSRRREKGGTSVDAT